VGNFAIIWGVKFKFIIYIIDKWREFVLYHELSWLT